MKNLILSKIKLESNMYDDVICVSFFDPKDDHTIGWRQAVRIGGSVAKLQEDLRAFADALDALDPRTKIAP